MAMQEICALADSCKGMQDVYIPPEKVEQLLPENIAGSVYKQSQKHRCLPHPEAKRSRSSEAPSASPKAKEVPTPALQTYRPNSSSSSNACDWHGIGNVDKELAMILDRQSGKLRRFAIITDSCSPAYCTLVQHIHSTLFRYKRKMGQPLFDRVKVQLDRGVAEVWAYHKASVDHRMFILKCKTCNEMSAIHYRPWKNAEVQARIIYRFSNS